MGFRFILDTKRVQSGWVQLDLEPRTGSKSCAGVHRGSSEVQRRLRKPRTPRNLVFLRSRSTSGGVVGLLVGWLVSCATLQALMGLAGHCTLECTVPGRVPRGRPKAGLCTFGFFWSVLPLCVPVTVCGDLWACICPRTLQQMSAAGARAGPRKRVWHRPQCLCAFPRLCFGSPCVSEGSRTLAVRERGRGAAKDFANRDVCEVLWS